MARLVVLAALSAASIGSDCQELSDPMRPQFLVTIDARAQHAQLIADLEAAIDSLRDTSKNFGDRYHAARAHLQPAADHRGCDIGERDDLARDAQVLRLVHGRLGEPTSAPSNFGLLLTDAENARDRLTKVYKAAPSLKEQGTVRLLIDQAAVDAKQVLNRLPKRIIIVVIEQETSPKVQVADPRAQPSHETRYQPGQRKGIAYFYSIPRKRFACLSQFSASNQTGIGLVTSETTVVPKDPGDEFGRDVRTLVPRPMTEEEAQIALKYDLDQQMPAAILKSLVAAEFKDPALSP